MRSRNCKRIRDTERQTQFVSNVLKLSHVRCLLEDPPILPVLTQFGDDHCVSMRRICQYYPFIAEMVVSMTKEKISFHETEEQVKIATFSTESHVAFLSEGVSDRKN